MNLLRLTGLVAATHTPFDDAGALNPGVVDQLAGLAPGDAAGVPLVVEAYGYLMEDMPNMPLTQASQLLPLNTTYWVGWPTVDNPYTYPSTWTQNAHLIIHNLQPASQ